MKRILALTAITLFLAACYASARGVVYPHQVPNVQHTVLVNPGPDAGH